MTIHEQVKAEMEVYSKDGKPVGRVKTVREFDFLVDRRLKRDVYVPFAAVQEASGNAVMLNVQADAIDDLGWQHPPLTGSDAGEHVPGGPDPTA